MPSDDEFNETIAKREGPSMLEDDMASYLVFVILENISSLRNVRPDHILVRLVDALRDADDSQFF